MNRRGLAALAAAAMLAGCSTLPLGPSVTVLPGTGKSLDQFQLDDGDCRQWALRNLGPVGGEGEWMTQRRYDIAYQQCMYARGNQIPDGPRPVAVEGPRVPVPPPDAGTPPPGTPPPVMPAPRR